MTTDADELDDLEAVVLSPGWRRIEARFQEQWGRSGSRYLDLLEKMANAQDRAQVADEIQRVIWVRKELELFFNGILTRVTELKNRKAPVSGSRRGVL